jgi:hypothetical protein
MPGIGVRRAPIVPAIRRCPVPSIAAVIDQVPALANDPIGLTSSGLFECAISLTKNPPRCSLAHWPSVTDVGWVNRAKACGCKPLLRGIRWVPVVRFTVSVQIPDALVRQSLCVDPRMQRIGVYLNARLIGGRRCRVGRWAYCESGYDKHDCDDRYD